MSLIEGRSGQWEVVIGLEVHAQIIGRAFDEETVLRVAAVIEKAAGFHYRPSTLAGEGGARRTATGG